MVCIYVCFFILLLFKYFFSFVNHLDLVSLHDYLCTSMKDAKIGFKLQSILHIYVQSIQQVCTFSGLSTEFCAT